jgi:hypothetical protein
MYPVAMNSLGYVVGSAAGPDGGERAVLWARESVTDLGMSQADGLNATGFVVGNTSPPGASSTNATLWKLWGH